MNLIEYNRELKRLKKTAPNHVLMATLEKGWSVVNAVYLRWAMRTPAIVKPKNAAELFADRIGVPILDKEADQPATDPVLRDLWATRGKLFRLSGKTSNKFHVCKSDEERKAVSVELLGIWDQILDIKAQINHYEQYGQVMASEERFPLPDDPILLMKKLHAIRQSISEQRSKIKRLADQPDGPEKDRQIAEAEEKLNHLILYRGHAEQKSSRLEANVHE